MHNENEDMENELLKHLKTEGGFSVPHDYFNRLKQHSLEQTTGSVAEEHSGFKVPENYFDRSRQQILLKTTGNTALKIWYKRSLTKYAAAAAVACVTVFFWPIGKQDSSMAMNISDEEIIQYLEQNDVHDIPVTEVSLGTADPEFPASIEDHYIINQTDEHSIIEEL